MRNGVLVPIASIDAPALRLTIDGRAVEARAGRSVLAVMLEHGTFVRWHDVDGEKRAGFCLMGACQDCWVWLSPETRGRACTTVVEEGMRIVTSRSFSNGAGDV